jgi:excisionase family DNA binding protein
MTWLTVAEAATRAKAGKRSIYAAVKAGELRAAPINERGDLRIADAWIDAWLERLASRVLQAVQGDGETA